MIKKILFTIILLTANNSFAQQQFKQHWSTLYPVGTHCWVNEIASPPFPQPPRIDTTRFRNTTIIPAYNKNTQHLLLVEEPFRAYTAPSPNPPPLKTHTKILEFNENHNYIIENNLNVGDIENMLYDNNNNLIIQGIEHTTLGPNRYLYKYSPNGTLSKIKNISGLSNKQSIAIDNQNNIYLLTRQHKSTVLSPSFFQSTGDQNTIINNQDVISKYDANGNHIWSTFYFNNQSNIWAIAAGTTGLYVYGVELQTNSNSNYFGTANSHQPNATGIISNGDVNSGRNVFLTKFGFDGKRIWSTYYGPQISMVPMITTMKNLKPMEVVGDDVYIITDHILPQGINNKLNTANAAISTTPDITNATTLTKFSGTGTILWTSYLYDSETIYETPDKNLMLSGTNASLANLPIATIDAYQQQIKGLNDNITYVITPDGKNITYLSYFGDLHRENGISIPSKNGYYVIGSTIDYPTKSSPFHTKNAKYTKLEIIDTWASPFKYVGNFVTFLTNKMLSVEDHSLKNNNDINCKVYPNPTSDILYIENEEALSTNSYFVLFDINGKRLLEYKAIDSYKNNISLEHLPTGVYILELQTGHQKYQTKIIKK